MEKIYTIYNKCNNPCKWAIKIFMIIVLISVILTLAGMIISSSVNGEEVIKEETSFIPCNNSAGCVGKFPIGTDWHVCPICKTPISSVNVSNNGNNGNIAEEIVRLQGEIYNSSKNIEEIIEKRRNLDEERIKNFKAYDKAYAEKVLYNMRTLHEAVLRTEAFFEGGGEGVPGSLIKGYQLDGSPIWTEEKYFRTYPQPRTTIR